MAIVDQLKEWAATLPSQHYYAILRVRYDAPTSDIVQAFHSMSLKCHPDRYAHEDPDAHRYATEIFKRVVEAYSVLKDPELRKRYNVALKRRGTLRLDTSIVERPPAIIGARTLEQVATDERAKSHARKADIFLSIGKLDDARVALVSAIQHEPTNGELKERLQMLYDALALEPM